MALEPIETLRTTQSTTNIRSLVGIPENEKQLRKSTNTDANNQNSQVDLSASSMMKNTSSNDIDFAKIEKIKTAIQNGELKIDTTKIADFLIQELQSNI